MTLARAPQTTRAVRADEPPDGGFVLSGATVSVPGRTLVHPTDLHLEPGMVHGLVGHNGSGKSTLLKLLARQLPRTGGEAQFDGRPLDRWADRAFARAVAYMPQETPRGRGLTVLDLVRFGRYPWHGAFGRFGALDGQAVEAALALTHLDRFKDRAVDTLSGGERQRAWIAMMVAQESRFLLLDEPTSALDVAHQIDVLALVRDLATIRGVGVVMVLHDINMAARFCDSIVALREGRVVAVGTPATIMTGDALKHIYGLPMGVAALGPAGRLAYPL